MSLVFAHCAHSVKNSPATYNLSVEKMAAEKGSFTIAIFIPIQYHSTPIPFYMPMHACTAR